MHGKRGCNRHGGFEQISVSRRNHCARCCRHCGATSTSVATGATQQLNASVAGTSNTAVTWKVQGAGCSATACGTIGSAGLYAAPLAVPSPDSVTITATSAADSSKTASASIAICSSSATNTVAGINIPARHPRLFWTASRVKSVQAWVASTGYAGLNTPFTRGALDDQDMAFTCFVMNIAGACSQVIVRSTSTTEQTAKLPANITLSRCALTHS